MGMVGLLSPRVLWLLLWVQLCRGKCRLPFPTAQGHRVPVGSSRALWEEGFFPSAAEMRVRRSSGLWTLCLCLCPSGWERVSP